ncbi:hypothetical protein VNO77_27739 [Canavalia gladiata]|uniref:Uncharacterized protein n=1 Tax=Canavalia gladiata TaxID=3824 RepID=A0AAN9Q6R7_CANGL
MWTSALTTKLDAHLVNGVIYLACSRAGKSCTSEVRLGLALSYPPPHLLPLGFPSPNKNPDVHISGPLMV